MSEKDYLKMIDDLENKIPEPSDADMEWDRFLAEWKDTLAFVRQNLGEINSLVLDQFRKPIGKLLSGTRHEQKLDERDGMTHNFKDGFVLLRDWVQRKFRYVPQVHVSSNKHPKEWLYWTNGKVAYLQITGKVFPLNDASQQRGKNAAVYLMDLLSFPGRVALVTAEDFKKRITDAGEQYSSTKKSNTYKEAIRRINNLVGKTPSGKEFLLSTIYGCKINETFVAEFDPNPAQV